MKKIMGILIMTIIMVNSGSAYAADEYRIFFKKISQEHRGVTSIVGISVNSNEEIALGFSSDLDDDNAYINVYDSNGNFIKGYTFKPDGGYFFQYDEMDNITIYFQRGGICCVFDAEAKLINTLKFSNYDEERKYEKSISNNMSVMANSNLYQVSKSFYSTKLTKTDTDGNITVIYDMGLDNGPYFIKRAAALLLFGVFAFYYRKFINRKRFPPKKDDIQ